MLTVGGGAFTTMLNVLVAAAVPAPLCALTVTECCPGDVTAMVPVPETERVFKPSNCVRTTGSAEPSTVYVTLSIGLG